MYVYRTTGTCGAAMTVVAIALAGIVGCATAQPGGSPAASAASSPVPTPTAAAASAAASAGVGSVSAAASASIVGAPLPAQTVTVPGPAASSTKAPGPPAVRRSLLTQADSGLTVLLPVGAEVTVVLTPAMRGAWDQPAAQGGAVVRVSAAGGYPSDLPARAVFRAATPGTVQLTSQTDLACFHQTPRCAVDQQAWMVTVLVPAGP